MQNIAGSCQQTFENKNFVDITQQCFALLPQVNFLANNLNLRWRWRDRIQAIFLNLFYFIIGTEHNSYRVILGGVKKLKKLFLFAHFVTICPSFSFLTGRKVAFFPLNQEILQPLQLLTSGPSKVQGFSISTSHRRA